MTYLRYLIALFVVFVPLTNARYTPKLENREPQYFVDGKVRPEHYDIHLFTHVENCGKSPVFEGKVNITIRLDEKLVSANEKVRKIELNSHNTIKIKQCFLIDGSKKISAKFTFNNQTEMLTVQSSQDLTLNKKYILYIEYSGIHNDEMSGFYRSSYKTPGGKNRWLLTTQFQPNDARQAFPCFDEPKYKSTFKMAITISKNASNDGYHCLFNAPLIGKTETSDGVTYYFDKTPCPLSTYLVAFIVSDFKPTEPVKFESDYGTGTPKQRDFRTWGEEKYIKNGEGYFPQLVGSTAIKLLSEFVGVGFAYPKMDQVGIPDFAAGAMENWGLITYRERLLFYNRKTVSEYVKRDIVNVITHELTHQWFGDLVTLESWDYIWLNEGFATYLAFLISERVAAAKLNNSNWNTVGQMIVDETHVKAMETDALEHSRPMSFKVTNPNIVGSYFDSISYSKAASVLRMWSHALSEQVFRKGLNIYMQAMKERNSVPSDLIKSFERACNETNCINQAKFGLVSNLFEEWHSTSGYPVLFVQKTSPTTYKITQDQFLWYQRKNTSVHHNTFNIPVTYSYESKPQFNRTKPTVWLKKNEPFLEIRLGKQEKWIILNNKHTGYFRVDYENENWNALINQLEKNHSKIDEANRAQLINDAFSFGRSTYKDYKVGYDTAFSLVKYLTKEKNFVPWKTALNSFSFLNNKMSSSSGLKKFQNFVLSLVKPRFDNLGLIVKDENAHLDNLLRIDVGEWACSLGYKSCIEEALLLYKNPSKISADVRKIVYCTAVREGSDDVWDDVWKLYLNSPDNTQQITLLSTLGCSKSPKKLNEFLEKTITENSGIRKQDYTATFSSVYRSGNTRVALEFLMNKFEKIAQFYNAIDPLGPLLVGVSSRLNTEEDLNFMKELREKIKKSEMENVRVAEVSIGKAIEIIESNINWIKLKRGSIEKWLEKNVVSEFN